MDRDAVDSQGAYSAPADLQLSAADAAALASATSKDSYEVIVDGLQLRLNKDYTFSFRYLLQNEDPNDKSQNFGPYSPAFVVTAAEVYAALPDNRTTPTNVTTIAGFNSYQVKWDKPTFEGYVDTIVWESPTSTFTSASTVVYVGTSSQINILTSNLDPRYIKIIHRNKFLHANIDPALDSKYVVVGPITPKDPIVVDTTGPGNVSGVSTTGGIDTTGYLGFNGYVDISWSAVTGGDIRGYRIRFKPTTSSVYSYADSPGTGTSYRLTGLAVGVTYNVEVATYDQYNNTSTAYIPGTNISIPGTPTMSGYITAGAFRFGDGVVSGKRGLYFNDSNYWYINSSSTAEFKLGGPTSNYISWDGSELKVTGNLGVDGSTKIGGNIQLTTSGASIYNGTINASGNLTGNGFALNSTGLKVANGSNAVTLDASTGTITANAGSIASWTLSDTRLSKNNTIIDSSGYISLGDTNAGTIVKLSSTDPNYRIWVGNNNGSLASFSVSTTGALYATNANISGTVVITGGATKTAIDNAASTAATASSTANTANANATAAAAAAAVAVSTANAAYPAANFNKSEIIKKLNNTTNGTTINGGLLTTGTVVADNVVSTYVYAGYINADKINAGTIGAAVSITTPNITVGSDTNSYYFRTKHIRSGTSVEALGMNAINMMSAGTAGVVSNWYPYYTDSSSLGLVNPLELRWKNIFLINNPNVSSDQRFKNSIETSDLGLDFIKKITPRKYKLNSRSVKTVLDENGNEILHENSDKPITEPDNTDSGVRTHYGFVAQEIKSVLDEMGVYDSAAFWALADKDDPDSKQALLYEQFISPLTKAVQELSDMVESLQQEVNTLKGI